MFAVNHDQGDAAATGRDRRRPHADDFVGADPRLAVRVWGGAGRPVVLLHGLTHNLAAWDYLIEHLPPDAHVVALDFRSHGRSDRDDQHSYADYTSDVLHAVALAGERPLVIGHSWGARVALWAAAHHPDLFRGVVALDQALWNAPPEPTGPADPLDAAPLTDAQLDEILAPYEEWPRWIELVKRQYQQTPDGWICTFRPIDGRALVIAEAAAQPVEGLYAKITCPVAMIFATEDDDFGFAPPRGRRQNAAHLKSMYSTLEISWVEGDHGFYVDHPKKTAALIEVFDQKT